MNDPGKFFYRFLFELFGFGELDLDERVFGRFLLHLNIEFDLFLP